MFRSYYTHYHAARATVTTAVRHDEAHDAFGSDRGDFHAVWDLVLSRADSVPVQILRNKLMFTGEGRYDTALCTGGVVGFSYLRTYTTRAQAYLLYTTRIAPSWVDTVGLHSSPE